MASNPRRAELKALSAPLVSARQSGELQTINQGLRKIYKQQGHQTLYTMRQWNEQGMSVLSGERALLLWAKPRRKPQDDGEDEFTFFPLCYVFSEQQVIKR